MLFKNDIHLSLFGILGFLGFLFPSSPILLVGSQLSQLSVDLGGFKVSSDLLRSLSLLGNSDLGNGLILVLIFSGSRFQGFTCGISNGSLLGILFVSGEKNKLGSVCL
jgi:hypothetical protein